MKTKQKKPLLLPRAQKNADAVDGGTLSYVVRMARVGLNGEKMLKLGIEGVVILEDVMKSLYVNRHGQIFVLGHGIGK